MLVPITVLLALIPAAAAFEAHLGPPLLGSETRAQGGLGSGLRDGR